MKRFLAYAMVLLPVAAVAQQVPAEAQMDMWRGPACEVMAPAAPADATPEKLAAAAVFQRGGEALIDRAIPIYLEAGYSDQALAEYRSRLEESVSRIVNGSARTGEDPPYSFQDCSALIGQ